MVMLFLLNDVIFCSFGFHQSIVSHVSQIPCSSSLYTFSVTDCGTNSVTFIHYMTYC